MIETNRGEICKLTKSEREQIKKVCDLTKYYFMEQYLLSLSEFSENLIYTMVNDMDKYYTDSNAEVLNRTYINSLKKRGIAVSGLEDAEIILKRSNFERFAKFLNYELSALVESGHDVNISSDSKKLFADIEHTNYANSVLDRCLKNCGIPNYSSIMDCCRITINRDDEANIQTCASRVMFPIEKEDETTEDISDLIHNYVQSKDTVKFIDIPLEECYGKYFEKENNGMETN